MTTEMDFQTFLAEQGVEQQEDTNTIPRLIPTFEDGITLADLQRIHFPPLRWITARILPAGCTLLAGKPKAKKSWFALNLALAVARTGAVALGSLATETGRVLYMDLESTHRRLKKRVHDVLGEESPWPDNVHIFRSWPAGQEGIEQLEDWMLHAPDTVLIVVDILENLRVRKFLANQYEEDTKTMQALSQFSGRHNIALIAIHHTRKAKADHVFDEISGSTGLSGGADSMLVLCNEPQGSKLHIKGRDIEKDDPLPMRWDETIRSWIIIDQIEMYGDLRQEIQSCILEAGESLSLADICALLPDTKKSTLQSTLQRMVRSGQLERTKRGRYGLVGGLVGELVG